MDRTTPARGLVVIHTGDGKGKTTAALGTALRQAGYGRRVLFVQFIKGTWPTGEMESIKLVPLIELQRSGAGFHRILDDHATEEEHRAAAAAGLGIARAAVSSGEYALVVLDEVLYALGEGLVSLDEILAILDVRRPEVSVILTGRGAPPELVELADTVTEMRSVKHAFERGIPAVEGIDF